MIVAFRPTVRHRTMEGITVTSTPMSFQTQEAQIDYLRTLADEYRSHPVIRELARDIVFRQFWTKTCDRRKQAHAIGSWVQHHLQYVRELPEVFQSPLDTLRLRSYDCDDGALLIVCLLESIGIEGQLIGLEWPSPDGRMAFQHIYARAVIPLPGGRSAAIPLDPTLPHRIEDETDPLLRARQLGLKAKVYIG